MSIITESGKFESQKKKLEGLCDEHNLVYTFKGNTYPITMVIKTTGDIGGQMSMLEEAEEDGYRSPDAQLIFSIKHGEFSYEVNGGAFRINKTLFGKLENIFKKMHEFWLQHFHKEIILNDVVADEQMPEIDAESDESGIVDEAFEEAMNDTDDEAESFDELEEGDYEYDEPDEPEDE